MVTDTILFNRAKLLFDHFEQVLFQFAGLADVELLLTRMRFVSYARPRRAIANRRRWWWQALGQGLAYEVFDRFTVHALNSPLASTMVSTMVR